MSHYRLVGMVEIEILHIIYLRGTFDLSLMKITPSMIKIWSGHKIQGSIPRLSTVTLALNRHGHSDKYLTKVALNLSKDSGDVEQTGRVEDLPVKLI